jgi:acylphosphatase
MSNDEKHRLHAIVHGLVQGVNFRYYTEQEAHRLGITGWVMNRRDRTVEVTAEGTKSALDALLSWLHQGSPSSRVDKVDSSWNPASGEFTEFTTRYVD